MESYAYEWAKSRGYFGRRVGARSSHLLLDGGILCVPDDAASDFLGAYAIGVVRARVKKPCVVEIKTPVFRMFYDLDIRVTTGMADEFSRRIPPAVREFVQIVSDVTRTFFGSESRVVVCASNVPKRDGDTAKMGVHVTFDDIFATTKTAMRVRDLVLETLASRPTPFENDWPEIVDAAVFKGSGMRLPWSAKKNENDRWYVPMAELDGTEWTDIDAVTVGAVRDVLKRVSLRWFGDATVTDDPGGDDDDPRETNLTHASLREHEALVASVESCIPKEYDGKITAVLRGDHSFIFRHSSRYCANVRREHATSNTYFLLTRSGLCQCCYSRKDEYSCRDFRGEPIQLPKHVIYAAFPDVMTVPSAMPSRSMTMSLDDLFARSRGSRGGGPKTARRSSSSSKPQPLSILCKKS